MSADFLSDVEKISWTSTETNFDVKGVAIGEGRQSLEVVIANASSRPTKENMKKLWRERWDQRANPVLAVVLYDSYARVFGPDESGKIDQEGIEDNQLERICRAALEEPNRHAARRFLNESLSEFGDGLAGLRNQGLLSTHDKPFFPTSVYRRPIPSRNYSVLRSGLSNPHFRLASFRNGSPNPLPAEQSGRNW